MRQPILFCLSVLLLSSAQAFMPQAGVWIVTAEENGKPGRGMGIDVQNDIFAMQVYAYDDDGRPSFFTAVGALADNQISTEMMRHEGGPSFASGPRQAVTVGSVGRVSLRFTDALSGFVTFPGEMEKAISRLNFGYAATAENLKGAWVLTTYTPEGWVAEVPLLQVTQSSGTNGNGLVASADGRYGCENQISGAYAGSVLCVKLNAQNALEKTYVFKNSVNEGDGNWWPAGSNVGYSLYVRRLVSASTSFTGQLRNQLATAGVSAIQAHLNALGAQAAAR
ncbi:hypothetical protein PSQ39_11455 [Curvibacter sp. HBC28]|uniref:Uncharacterized protein n=1 Tax=Curvibacter microcysteis TaxID=3026419 RepID=A0ABT5MFA0_9BURK|nr:hypothetical protein [Curvibacter sp. HBC28]MDD0815248.1 hypothetical protein [Curvibacter sp. HBC28]